MQSHGAFATPCQKWEVLVSHKLITGTWSSTCEG